MAKFVFRKETWMEFEVTAKDVETAIEIAGHDQKGKMIHIDDGQNWYINGEATDAIC